VNILSGCTKSRFESELNHRAYANRHGYNYLFDSKPRDLKSPYDHKMYAILDQPIDNEWCFWMDDDAFFMQMDTPLESFLTGIPRYTQMIFPKSPINPQGGWTHLSSGNFFFKRTQFVHDFFAEALQLDLMMIRNWWNADKYGMFTKGDQDKIVYELAHSWRMRKATKIVPFDTFNFRPYHFVHSAEENFLVHFATPGISKDDSITEFQAGFGFADRSLLARL
jgi:galactosyl transferase GMA12/MNN10 family